MDSSFILKAEVNRMVLAGGEDLDEFDCLASDLFKAIESPAFITANCRLAALGFGKAQGGWKAHLLLWVFGFAGFG